VLSLFWLLTGIAAVIGVSRTSSSRSLSTPEGTVRSISDPGGDRLIAAAALVLGLAS
jgi:hypothetical protein